MKIQTGMIFANRISNNQVIIDRVEFGFVFYCPINGLPSGWYVSEKTFLKYHSIYCGSII